MTAQQYTPSNVAINMPWGTGTQQGIYGSNGLVGFASAGTSYFEVNTSGLRVAGSRSIGLGGTIASPEVLLFSGSNVLEQRNGVSAQAWRLYGTYTDASNYRRLYISSTTAGAFTLGVEGAGTGASGNTLTIPNALGVSGTLTITGNGVFSGSLSATTKSFLIDHPTKPGRKLQYGSLESPYHGIRLTGRTFIEGGMGVIELPEYVRAFVRDDVNVQLTPIGRNTLWIDYVDLNNNQVIVGGDSDGEFYWSFTGIRIDVELEVEPWE